MFEAVRNERVRRLLTRVSSRARRRRAKRILNILQYISAYKGEVRVLDLGGEPEYWLNFDRQVLRVLKVHVTLVNPAPIVVSDPMFTAHQADACSLPQFADNSFHFVHSNSVIEHVGGWAEKEAFAREVQRLAPHYFVQTPYQWFPVEPHWVAPFVHWLSEHWRARWLMWTRPEVRKDYRAAMHIVEGARLLDRSQMRCLFADARLSSERFMGLTKSIMAIRSPA